MSKQLALLAILVPLLAISRSASAAPHVLVVGGLGGTPEYRDAFATQSHQLADVSIGVAGSPSRVTRLSGPAATRTSLERALRSLRDRVGAQDLLVVFLVGHGTYDGEEYKFNLPGPDLSGKRLIQLLDAVPARRQLIVNTTSSSGALADALKAPGRIVVTATRSGSERGVPRFGEYFVKALSDPSADLDKDRRVTLQEAFDAATRLVADYYAGERELQTEHARMEGSGGDRIVLARLDASPSARPAAAPGPDKARDPVSVDPRRAALEREIEALQARKEELGDEAYFAALEKLLLELAQLERQGEPSQEDRSAPTHR